MVEDSHLSVGGLTANDVRAPTKPGADKILFQDMRRSSVINGPTSCVSVVLLSGEEEFGFSLWL